MSESTRVIRAVLVKVVAGSAGIRMAGMAFSFLVGVQLARSLGVEGYGLYGLAMSIVSIASVPAEFGLPQLVTREVAAANAQGNSAGVQSILFWATKVNLFFAAVSLCVVLFLVESKLFFDRDLSSVLYVGMLLIPVVGQVNIRSAAIRSLNGIVKGQVPEVLIRPAFFSFLIFLYGYSFDGLGATAAMALSLCSALCSFLVATRFLNQLHRADDPCFEKKPMIDADWLRSALPMALTQGMHVLQGNAMLLVLGMLSDIVTVGTFRVATSVLLMVGFPVSLLNMVSAPYVSRLFAQSNLSSLQIYMGYFALAMFFGSIVVAMPFVFWGGSILQFVFGEQFLEALAPILVLCAGLVVSGFFGVNVVLLNMCGHERRVTRAFFSSLVLLLSLGALLIPFYGAVGAALSKAISLVYWNVTLWRDGKRLLGQDSSLLYPIKRVLG